VASDTWKGAVMTNRRRNKTWIGLHVAGDLGPFTTWTTQRGKQAWMLKSPPKQIPSPGQVAQRAIFRAAVTSWWTLTAVDHSNYETAVVKLSIPFTGYNMFLSGHMRGNWKDVDQMAALTGLSLPHP